MSEEDMFDCHNWTQELLLACLEGRGQGCYKHRYKRASHSKEVSSRTCQEFKLINDLI